MNMLIPIFLALAVWFAILFVGFMMKVVTPLVKSEGSPNNPARQQAVVGISLASAIGILATIAYGVVMQDHVKTATFWAGAVIVLTVLINAIYTVGAPVNRASQQEKDQQIVSSVALAMGVLTFIGGMWLKMRT